MKAYLLTCGLAAFLMGCSGADRGFTPPTQGPLAGIRPGTAPAASLPAWQQYNRADASDQRGPGDSLRPGFGSPKAGAIASATGDALRSTQRTPYAASVPASTSPAASALLPDARSKEIWANEALPVGGTQNNRPDQPPLRGINPESLPRGTELLRGASTPSLIPEAQQPLLVATPDTPEKPAREGVFSQLPPRVPTPPVADSPPRPTPPETTGTQPRPEEKTPPGFLPAKYEEKQFSTETVTAKPAEEKPAAAVPPQTRMVNSKRIVLNYALKDVGPSGVSAVELWYTRDGRAWQKDDSGVRTGPPYTVEVPEEGTYGFTLVARNGIGLGKEPPKPGDLPQVWVDVDLTRPTVSLADVKHGVGGKAREVTIQWEARDRNLSRRPITLSYATAAEGPWFPFAANIENSGQHTWQMPLSAPVTFFTRIEAVDMVGNIGVAQTAKPTSIDTSLPTTSILGVEGAEK